MIPSRLPIRDYSQREMLGAACCFSARRASSKRDFSRVGPFSCSWATSPQSALFRRTGSLCGIMSATIGG